MALLARELARRGLRVAFVVLPIPDDHKGRVDPRITLVEREEHAGSGRWYQRLLESVRVLRALVSADGRIVVVRSGTPVVGLAGLYCRLWRRKLVFSSANNLDFLDQWSRRMRIYAFGVRSAAAVVVQSQEQVVLARKRFPTIRELVRIPSFAEPFEIERRTPSAFYWVGRLVEYKRPALYAELAECVPEARFVLVPLTPVFTEEDGQRFREVQAAAGRLANLEVRESIPQPAVVAELAGAVAIVSTSSHEGMPNTFLEAWSIGVPALTLSFDPDGVIRESGLGVAADGSWEDFVEGARRMWANRLDDEYAERTCRYVRDAHSLEAVGAQWHSLLESLGATTNASRDAVRPSP
jgi:glycosyltransferase involved in cell wall biosynthesis